METAMAHVTEHETGCAMESGRASATATVMAIPRETAMVHATEPYLGHETVSLMAIPTERGTGFARALATGPCSACVEATSTENATGLLTVLGKELQRAREKARLSVSGSESHLVVEMVTCLGRGLGFGPGHLTETTSATQMGCVREIEWGSLAPMSGFSWPPWGAV